MACVKMIKCPINICFIGPCLLLQQRPLSITSARLKSIRWKDIPDKRKNIWIYHRTGKGRIKSIDASHIGDGIFDTPFPLKLSHIISPKEVHPTKVGGSQVVMDRISRDPARYGHAAGYYDKEDKFHEVPEMIPEFVVPDLSKCSLRPYVCYTFDLIEEPEFTPLDLFRATYARQLMDLPNLKKEDVREYLDKFLQEHDPERQAQKEDVEAPEGQENVEIIEKQSAQS